MSDNLRGLMRSTDPKAIELWDRICTEYDNAQDRARAYLRSIGVKLAHPDDGWVKRHRDGGGTFHRSWYPLFDDRPEVGDLMAFGYPYSTEHTVIKPDSSTGAPRADQGYRIVRVTKVERRHSILGYMQDFEFEPTDMTWPPVRPTPASRLRRLLAGRRTK